MSYASRLARDPRETYRQVDLASRTGGASPHQLIAILYEDLLRELRLGALAIDAGDKGGTVAATLSRFYRGCRDAVMRASIEANAALIRDVVGNVSEIADSWKAIGGR
jgi:flagellar secretion chaperone FliS